MNMQSSSNISSSVGSSTGTVSAPVIGDDYVLVKKSSILDEKKQEQKNSGSLKALSDTQLFGLGNRLMSRAGGRFGSCNGQLTFDFSITPSTSSTFQTVVALAPAQYSSFTSHWATLFTMMKMNSAEVQLDFTEFTSTIGHDVALSPLVMGFSPNAFSATQYYADVSDWKNAKFVGYSLTKPIVRFKIPNSWLLGWNIGHEASSVGTPLSQWASTKYTSSTLVQGFFHIASQKAMFDTSRDIVGRLVMNMTFKGQL